MNSERRKQAEQIAKETEFLSCGKGRMGGIIRDLLAELDTQARTIAELRELVNKFSDLTNKTEDGRHMFDGIRTWWYRKGWFGTKLVQTDPWAMRLGSVPYRNYKKYGLGKHYSTREAAERAGEGE